MSPSSPFVITPFNPTTDLPATTALFRAYAASLDLDLSFQNFEMEISALPGAYTPPGGALLLARHPNPNPDSNSNLTCDANPPIGCIALRSLPPDPNTCELKRLYTHPTARGHGLGRLLTTRMIALARDLGYKTMRLDTLPTMTAARALYDSLGFVEIDAYYPTPVRGTVFLELRL